MNILHIDSSASGASSVSRKLTAAAVRELRTANPGASVVYRDLGATPPAHLDGRLLAALRPLPDAEPVVGLDDELAFTEALLAEFLAADVIVIGAPMYNFSVPSQLKAWIDRLAQPGRTFRYTAKGPEGLAGGRKVIVLSSRGGLYAALPHETAMDHQEAYLRAVFGFFGVADIEIIRAEGVSLGAEARERSMEQALAQAHDVAQEEVAA